MRMCDVCDFESLEAALEGHYERLLADLPDNLRQWVERDFPSVAPLGDGPMPTRFPSEEEATRSIRSLIQASKHVGGSTTTADHDAALVRRSLWDVVGPSHRRLVAQWRT